MLSNPLMLPIGLSKDAVRRRYYLRFVWKKNYKDEERSADKWGPRCKTTIFDADYIWFGNQHE